MKPGMARTPAIAGKPGTAASSSRIRRPRGRRSRGSPGGSRRRRRRGGRAPCIWPDRPTAPIPAKFDRRGRAERGDHRLGRPPPVLRILLRPAGPRLPALHRRRSLGKDRLPLVDEDALDGRRADIDAEEIQGRAPRRRGFLENRSGIGYMAEAGAMEIIANGSRLGAGSGRRTRSRSPMSARRARPASSPRCIRSPAAPPGTMRQSPSGSG